ncbi:MAG: GAF domain-containing protein, partial [Chloroflexi bacterium]|nr:GAF domain-containing protein [Chloroflexota bacterium]
MALSQQAPVIDKSPVYRTSLAGSLVRTLMIFTFIPMTLLAGAAYLRAHALLREQVLSQMQVQLTTQIHQADLAVKTKEIRLDRLVRGPNFASQMEIALHANQSSAEFRALRDDFSNQVRSLNPEVGKAIFNQYFLIRPDGVIRMASNPAWEGVSLKDTALYETLNGADHESFTAYDLAPLYPGQLILVTISQYNTPTGSHIGTLVGITESQGLQDILQGLISTTPNSDAYFVTANGTFIGTDPYTKQLTVFQPSDLQNKGLTTALDGLMNQTDVVPQSLEFRIADNSPVIAQATWVQTMHAGIVLEVHQEQVYGQLNSLIPFTIAIFLIALLAMGAVIWLGAQRVFRPLVTLAGITQRYAEGNFDQRAEVKSRDEIGLLANSFNTMAEELSGMYRSLEQKVEERTRQIRTAAEVAQRITSTTNLDELLNRTVELLVQQFEFYHASVFLLDRGGKFALLRAAYGPAAKEMLARGHRLEVGSASIIGWVSANNQPRIASDVAEDPIHLKNELLPETRSEAGIPISVGNLVLGALDVQSTQANVFGAETIVMLQTLASQLAVAIQNVGLVASTEVNFQELERLYRASRQIASAQTKAAAMQAAANVLKDSPYPAAVLSIREGQLQVEAMTDPDEANNLRDAVRGLNVNLDEVQKYLSGSPVITEATSTNLPAPLTRFAQQMNYQSAAFLPIMSDNTLAGLITMGGRKQTLTSAVIQPYANMTDLIGTTFDKVTETELKEKQLAEREALATISHAVAASSAELNKFYAELHSQVRQNIGDYAFVIALYDQATHTVSIPYTYEEGRVDKIESFPLGEGLTSILIRSQQPLLLANDTERRAIELGAKIVGKAAKSWMGAPMLVQNEPIGALIIQDLEHENAFDEESLSFFSAVANQVAAVIHNARLLEESRARALQLQTAAEIARDISSSLNLDELLAKAVNYIRERFDFYHASIFLLDLPREFAVIREATGEAGAQMKRAGHKLGVGSKSIVGYVAGQGEPLIVNDTAKDATYYANPLLPDTRSEAAIPLKVGERIVGVMDVQSRQPYAFSDDNLRTLQILSDQMAVAVVNSELFAETQEHLSQHRLLHHITTTTASGSTLEEALDNAVTGLQVTLGGDRVSILLADREKKLLEVKAAVGYSEEIMQLTIPIGTGITGWAAAHRRSLRVDDVTEDPRYIQASSNTRSELAVPLVYRNELLGVLNVESEQVGAYTENDEELLGTLGGSLAAIIANARLLEQIR